MSVNHKQAVTLAAGGFRVTRFEIVGQDLVRIVYARVQSENYKRLAAEGKLKLAKKQRP